MQYFWNIKTFFVDFNNFRRDYRFSIVKLSKNGNFRHECRKYVYRQHDALSVPALRAGLQRHIMSDRQSLS